MSEARALLAGWLVCLAACRTGAATQQNNAPSKELPTTSESSTTSVPQPPSQPKVSATTDDKASEEERVVNGAAGDPYARECETQVCRPGAMRGVKVESPDATAFMQPVPRQPYVQTNSQGVPFLRVYPGDVVALSGDLVGGRLTNLRAGPAGAIPKPSIVIRMYQGNPDTHEGTDTFVALSSGFPVTLRYKAFMEVPPRSMDELARRHGRLPIQYTSSCPLMPDLVSYEHWPHPIFSLIITEVAQVDPDDPEKGACK